MNSLYLALFFVVALPTNSAVAAENNLFECDYILVQHIPALPDERREQLALYRLVTKDNFDKARKSFGNQSPNVRSMLEGTFTEFEEKRRKLFDKLKYDRDDASARSIATSTASGRSLNAWRECALRENKGFYAYMKVASPSGSKGAVGFSGNSVAQEVSILIRIEGQESILIHKPKLTQDPEFDLPAPSADKDVWVSVSGYVGKEKYDGSFTIPRKIIVKRLVLEEPAIPIKGLLYDWATDTQGTAVDQDRVKVNAPGGHRVTVTATAKLPNDHVIVVSDTNPTPIVSPVPVWDNGTAYLADITPVTLVAKPAAGRYYEKQVVFTFSCGRGAGKNVQCDAILHGKMNRLVAVEWEL